MLTGKQRSHLKAQAHNLTPIAQIGKNGLEPANTAHIDTALTDHELIKVKFLDHKAERRELAERLAKETGAELVEVIGNVAVLYRASPDDEKRRITFPP